MDMRNLYGQGLGVLAFDKHDRSATMPPMQRTRSDAEMRQKAFDSRMAFVREALNKGLTANANLANEWYVSNARKGSSTNTLIDDFADWLGIEELQVEEHE